LPLALDLAFLRYRPLGFDILPLYVLLLLAAPLALWLIYKRKTLWLIGGSILLYALYHLSPQTFEWDMVNKQRSLFPFMTWQLLFVGGMLVAANREALARWHSRKPSWLVPAAVAGLFSAFFVLRQLLNVDWVVLHEATFDFWFDKAGLSIGRLLNFAVVAVVIYTLVDRFWRPLSLFPGRVLIPLGQVSLYVFIVHLVFVYIYRVLQQANVPLQSYGLYELLTVLLIWLMVRRRALFRLVPH
jgi:hypothetical protein